jgi:hypothetical protein
LRHPRPILCLRPYYVEQSHPFLAGYPLYPSENHRGRGLLFDHGLCHLGHGHAWKRTVLVFVPQHEIEDAPGRHGPCYVDSRCLKKCNVETTHTEM